MSEKEESTNMPDGQGSDGKPENPQGGNQEHDGQKGGQHSETGVDEKLEDLNAELEKYKGLSEKFKKEAGDYRISKKEVEQEVDRLKGEIQQTKRESDFIREAVKAGLDADLALAYAYRKGFDGEVEIPDFVQEISKEKPALKVDRAVATGDSGSEEKQDSGMDLNSWITKISKKAKG